MKLYLDASTIIYGVESASPFRESVLARIAALSNAPGSVVLTSRLSRLECRVKPLRDADATLLAVYDSLFGQAALCLVEIGPTVVDLATELRVRYDLKTPDALHVATAIQEHADVFLTGGKQFSRCTELSIEVLT
jgi:uncharacterized protein